MPGLPVTRPLSRERAVAAVVLLAMLSACASQVDAGVSRDAWARGLWWGLGLGLVLGFGLVGWVLVGGLGVYAVPNRGGWYDFGFFLGVTVLGGGSWFSSKSRN